MRTTSPMICLDRDGRGFFFHFNDIMFYFTRSKLTILYANEDIHCVRMKPKIAAVNEATLCEVNTGRNQLGKDR
jgi:hypothetical protein